MNAYTEGFDAYNRGDDLAADNPYDAEDPEYEEWREGWNSGADCAEQI